MTKVRALVRESERGEIAPLAVMVCLMLVAALGLVINHGVAYAVKSQQEQAIDAARASCMDAAGAVPAKYAQDPGRSLAATVAHSVRAQGVSAPLTVWFYEAPAQVVPQSERLWVIGIQVEQRMPLPFSGGFAPDALTVASSRVVTAKPYASEAVWRPERRICGVYRYPEGATGEACSFSSIASLEGFPDELVEAARAVTFG